MAFHSGFSFVQRQTQRPILLSFKLYLSPFAVSLLVFCLPLYLLVKKILKSVVCKLNFPWLGDSFMSLSPLDIHCYSNRPPAQEGASPTSYLSIVSLLLFSLGKGKQFERLGRVIKENLLYSVPGQFGQEDPN